MAGVEDEPAEAGFVHLVDLADELGLCLVVEVTDEMGRECGVVEDVGEDRRRDEDDPLRFRRSTICRKCA